MLCLICYMMVLSGGKIEGCVVCGMKRDGRNDEDCKLFERFLLVVCIVLCVFDIVVVLL